MAEITDFHSSHTDSEFEEGITRALRLPDTMGAAGQVLKSTGMGTEWGDASGGPSAKIDSTLSIPGEAADAAATGAAITSLNQRIDAEASRLSESTDEISDVLEIGKGTKNLFDKYNVIYSPVMKRSSGIDFVNAGSITAVVVEIVGGGVITVDNQYGNRFQINSSVEFPAIGVTISNIGTASLSTHKGTIQTSNGDKYLHIYMYNAGGFDPSELRVYYGTEWTDGGENVIDYLKEEVTSAKANASKAVADVNGVIFSKLGLDKSIKLVSYKPLGVLSKGYICLSCDDGAEALTSITIPKLKEMKQAYGKNIPMTFALMTSSNVFGNDEKKALVQEMLANYGCSVAIHGSESYTTYSDDGLIAFLDEQKERLAVMCGVEPSAIIFPNHDYNEKTATIAGSYFGVCGTGGVNKPIYYSSYTAGERSNMYTLYRMSLLGGSTNLNTLQKKKDQIKAMIDYCVANHKICLPFFHDVDFTRDGTYFTAQECMEIFEYCVSYAVGVGITFCTFGDITTLT